MKDADDPFHAEPRSQTHFAITWSARLIKVDGTYGIVRSMRAATLAPRKDRAHTHTRTRAAPFCRCGSMCTPRERELGTWSDLSLI